MNTQDTQHSVEDRDTFRKYFTIIPNLIDDLGLTLYEFRLYVHLKRVAGEDGKCWQSTNTLAKICGMGMGSVSKARNGLKKRGLINIIKVKKQYGGKPMINVIIVDIWQRNLQQATAPKTLSISVGEKAISVGEIAISPGEINKNQVNKNQEKDLKDYESFSKIAEESSTSKKVSNATLSHQQLMDLLEAFPKLKTPKFEEVWGDWIEDRRERKRPMTSRGAIMQLKKLSKLDIADAIARTEKAIIKGWQGIVFPEDEYPKNATPSSTPGQSVSPQIQKDGSLYV